jgi:hypothetical protein
MLVPVSVSAGLPRPGLDGPVAVPGDGEIACLLDKLASVPDPRDSRGLRYPLTALLAIVVCAMTGSGHDSFASVSEWCRRATGDQLGRLGVPKDPFTGRRRVPSERTFRDALALVDPAALTRAGFAFLRPLIARAAGVPVQATAPGGVIEREQRRAHRAWQAADQAGGRVRRQAYAVDGKYLRGARRPDGSRAIVLSAVRHGDGVTIAAREIAAKTNEVRHEALCRIPYPVRRNSEGNSWARWLTRIRKVMGTRACHEYRRSCPDARGDAPGGPRDMAKAILPESQSPAMQVFIHRKRHLKPVPRSASGYFVARCTIRDAGDAQ